MDIQFGFVEIVTSDMATALSFYRALGATVPEAAANEPHVEGDLWGVRVAWDTEETMRSFDPSFEPAVGGGRITLAFELGSPQQVDALYQSITDAGFTGHLPPWNAVWGQRYAVLRDPDGNAIDLYAPLAAKS